MEGKAVSSAPKDDGPTRILVQLSVAQSDLLRSQYGYNTIDAANRTVITLKQLVGLLSNIGDLYRLDEERVKDDGLLDLTNLRFRG
jgi:hypothetical protein